MRPHPPLHIHTHTHPQRMRKGDRVKQEDREMGGGGNRPTCFDAVISVDLHFPAVETFQQFSSDWLANLSSSAVRYHQSNTERRHRKMSLLLSVSALGGATSIKTRKMSEAHVSPLASTAEVHLHGCDQCLEQPPPYPFTSSQHIAFPLLLSDDTRVHDFKRR